MRMFNRSTKNTSSPNYMVESVKNQPNKSKSKFWKLDTSQKNYWNHHLPVDTLKRNGAFWVPSIWRVRPVFLSVEKTWSPNVTVQVAHSIAIFLRVTEP